MVIFDQLRISDDGKKMNIDLHISNAEYFDNVYLDSLTIMTADKVSETNPHQPTEDFVYTMDFDEDAKEAHIVLTPEDFNVHFSKSNFSSDLFFVYVKVKGTPDPCTPCGLDSEVTVNVTFNEKILYQIIMDYTKSLADDCKLPKGFIDLILQWYAFKASIETGHFIPAFKFWKMLFSNHNTVLFGVTKNCGCHG